jgi:hypothetical protein
LSRKRLVEKEVLTVLFLVAALLLLGLLLGTVAHAPAALSVTLAVVVAVWLAVFAYRERHGRRQAGGHRTPAH